MGFDLSRIDLHDTLIWLLVVVISISVHEFAHALAADRLGDDLPRRQGRLTLLPTEHFDPVGFLMIVFLALGGVGLGWGKPVQVNPAVFRHPRRDMSLIAIAGPFSNLILAVVCGLLLRMVVGFQAGPSGEPSLAQELLHAFVVSNLGLMFFNMIPIPPLDGSKVLSNILPFEQSVAYDRTMGQYGVMLLLLLVFLGRGVLGMITGQPTAYLYGLILGLG